MYALTHASSFDPGPLPIYAGRHFVWREFAKTNAIFENPAATATAA